MTEWVLLDWTRMGKTYCLAGVIAHKGQMKVVRPLMAKNRSLGDRKIGWWAKLLDGRKRWEVFELVGSLPADGEAPHLEDWWVHGLRPRGKLADVEQRRRILEATSPRPGEPLFGAPLSTTRSAVFLHPGTGTRSLATVQVAAANVRFAGSLREGAAEPDFRVQLSLPEVGDRSLPVKDHQLLVNAAAAGPDVQRQIDRLNSLVQAMGPTLGVRLGLSRAFGHDESRGAVCWLMADGFFSWADPQP